MKKTFKIGLIIYLIASSLALVSAFIYSKNEYVKFRDEQHLQSVEEHFYDFCKDNLKADTSFTRLFNKEPRAVLDYLIATESNENSEESSVKFKILDTETIESIKELTQCWPYQYRDLLKNNVSAIYVVDSVGFNGKTFESPLYNNRFIIVLNSKIFNTLPNNWATNEITKSVIDTDKSSVRACLYADSLNVPIRTVEHVLIHELSHIYGILKGMTPSFDGHFSQAKGLFPFIEKGFIGGYISYENSETKWPEIERESSLSLKSRIKDLQATDFPTPYSTQNSHEFVAECLTFFIHKKYIGQKYVLVFNQTEPIELATNIDHAFISGLF